MGTEVALTFSALRTQLENEKSSLCKLDENIKKIVQTGGRFQNDRFNTSGDYSRGGPRFGGRNSFPEAGIKTEDLYGKRRHETKTVFSRLSARVHDSDGEDDVPGGKRARMPSAVSRELPTRAAVLRAQGDDEQARTRNRRIFGSLLGTLQKFKQEEIVLQTKEDKKAQVERKIEEQARLQKEKELKERKSLFAERDLKKATIKALEAKMGRVQEFERWEASQKNLANFILTKSKPHVYWLPKKMSDRAHEKLMSSRKFLEKCMEKKRIELQGELQRIEQRCLRRGPAAKENDPESQEHQQLAHDEQPMLHSETSEQGQDGDDDTGRRRDKFATDVEKEDSEGEEHHLETGEPQPESGVPQPEELQPEDPQTETEAQGNQQLKEETESKLETMEESSTALEVEGSQPKAKSPEHVEANGDAETSEETTTVHQPDSNEDKEHS